MKKTLKCLLLDDELPGLTYLRMLCEQLPQVEVVKAFNSPERFLEEYKSLDFDFFIVDIEMPGFSGLEIAQLLKEKPVIICTAYKEYAADAFDLEAVDYIVKPIRQERLQKAVEKMENLLKQREPLKDFIQMNTSKGKAILFFDKLLHITATEPDKRDKCATLTNGDQLILKNVTFQYLLSVLPPDTFCRISKKDIISLKAVQYFSFDEVTLILKDQRPVSLTIGDAYRQHFLELLRR
ncbi:response regulator transcription factor [Pontibacter qinzhouensis]|uniref:Response regulator transcription factor n=1 Tax=Pontibacter qinzhouensis TaxID=2603253 RepID=A0A5C8KAF7_9BACT|nr:response regulator [Pontibacter qinzhouensis]TXK49247.1 response regulator transcription factor [Pontibacter qinzhouensis]